MTVRELARRIGVSASHVSQVERGIGAFSVPALYAAARELGVPMSELLSPRETAVQMPAPTTGNAHDLRTARVIQRSADHPTIKLSSGPRWSRLTPTGETDSEFLEVVYAPGTTAPADVIRHAGREYGIVISGRLNVMVDGAEDRPRGGATRSSSSRICPTGSGTTRMPKCVRCGSCAIGSRATPCRTADPPHGAVIAGVWPTGRAHARGMFTGTVR